MVCGTSIIYLLLHETLALAVLSMLLGGNACRRHDDSNVYKYSCGATWI